MRRRDASKGKQGRRRTFFCAGLLLLGTAMAAGCGVYRIPSGEIVRQEQEKTVIRILAGQSTSDAGTEGMMEKVLEEKFPEVEFEWTCVDWGDNFASQLEGMALSGNLPDILIGKAQDVRTYFGGGSIAPLSGDICREVDASILDTVTFDGEVYGLPYNTSFQGVLYNKDIFQQYGLTPPDTMEELRQIAAELEENGITPFACHFQESWKVGNMLMQFFVNDLFAHDPLWGDHFREGAAAYSGNEQVRRCFEYNSYILEHTFSDALQINQYESDIRFARGEAAMYLTGSWSLQALRQMVPETRVGIFPWPNEEGNAKLITETNMTFMKGGDTAHGELVDSILREIGQNGELAREIVDFTLSESTFTDLRSRGTNPLGQDIQSYREEGRIVNVSIGNSQLVWTFQNDVAAQALLWLQGRKELGEVLEYADGRRRESGA